MSQNMGYCRFQNTLEALRECNDALSESNDPLADLGQEEAKAARKLFRLCAQIASDFEDEVREHG